MTLNIPTNVDHSRRMTDTRILPGSLVLVTDPRLLKTQLGIVISVHDWRGPLVLTPLSFGVIKAKYLALA
jgi:hypothetical protein